MQLRDHKTWGDRSNTGQVVEDNPDDKHHRSHENELVAGNHQQVLEPEEECDHIFDHRNSLVGEGFYHGIRHGVDCSHVGVHVDHSHQGKDDDREIGSDSDHEACQAESKGC